MSMQQVNLYLSELRPRKEWLTAPTIGISALGFLCLLLLGSVLLKRNVEQMHAQVALLESQVSSSADRIAIVSKNRQAPNAARLDYQINGLKKAISAREQIGQIIQGQNLGNEEGFSESLLALSREAFSTISLQQIKISRGGKFVETSGVTTAAHDVPRYIQNLRQQSSLANTQFGLLSLTEDMLSHRLHHFSMGFDSLSKLATTKTPQSKGVKR